MRPLFQVKEDRIIFHTLSPLVKSEKVNQAKAFTRIFDGAVAVKIQGN